MSTHDLCSLDWDASGVPAWGTAKAARVIVCVEVAGAWGHSAVEESGLPTPDGTVLYLIRRPGHHALTPQRQTVLVAGGFGTVPWLAEGQLDAADVPDFLQRDVTDESVWAEFGLTATVDAAVLVCTNGRRDACCALRSRPLALAAAAGPHGERVWEVSHIGGHRFAPTAIHLPTGQTFGRLSEGLICRLTEAGRSGTLPSQMFDDAHHRGRVDLDASQRVAETLLRRETGNLALLPVVSVGPSAVDSVSKNLTRVDLLDGREAVIETLIGPALRDSCTKAPKPATYYSGTIQTRQIVE